MDQQTNLNGTVIGNSSALPDVKFWEEYLLPLESQGGCALLGKTRFDKLGAVRGFLANRGISVWNGYGPMGGSLYCS
jgi:hypothetical protein